jgi:hypothetical protein
MAGAIACAETVYMIKRKHFWTAGLLAAALQILASQPSAAEDKTILNFVADHAWHQIYRGAQGFKAMAVSENGAVGLSSGLASQAAANDRAREACTERAKYIALKQPSAPDCKLVTFGDTWLVSDLQPDPEWQQPLTGKDRPLQKAYKYMIPKSKGIILHVHGCDGRGGKVFSDVWGAYFNALGYDFIVPDSFAVKRPKAVCGFSNDYPPEQVSQVTRLRVKQTLQTLAGLRKANPGKPIYMWGHSEGGFIVQLVQAEVDGIIVSGEECGAYGAPPVSGKKVPFLYIWGEYDQFVNGLGFFKVDQASVEQCRRRMEGYTLEAALLPGKGHNPFPWNAEVNKAVAQFLKATPLNVANTTLTKRMGNFWKRTRIDKRYRKAAQHRAAAINPSGSSYMVWGLDNPEDAGQLALFGCALNMGKKTNAFRTGKHICALVDLNGAAPK